LVWLLRNAEPLRRGAATYNGTCITLDTHLRFFEATTSFLVISVRLRSRLFIEGPDYHARLGIACTLATLLFGWWGIPWGPIFTAQSLWHNVRGGRRTTVRHELADLGLSLRHPDRAADEADLT
jgi:hypothetical protein